MKLNIHISTLALTLSTLLGGMVGTPAQTYNAAAEFNITNGNPNGVWSYGWMPTDFSQFNLLPNTYSDHTYSIGWFGWNGDRAPVIWKNTYDVTGEGAPPGWIVLHPGPGTEPCILRWTAPFSGVIHVVGQYLPGNVGVMQVAVRQDGQTLWSAVDSGSFDLIATVSAGETVDFAVYGGYYFGNTPLDVNITLTGGSLPLAIAVQPKSQLGYWGKPVSFSVAVTNGVPPCAYQWRKDGADIPAATNSVLTLTNLQLTDAGTYTVLVSDTITNLLSQPATLTVNPAGVSIALYAGVTIDGVAGQTYGVQSTLDLSNTNSWVGRANVTLTNATQLWYDSQPATQPQTYYRVVPGPIPTP